MSKSNSINIIFVTSNKDKLREVKQILGDNIPIQLICYETDLLEFQSSNQDDITRAKCIEAIRLVGSDEKWFQNSCKINSNVTSSSVNTLNPNYPTFIMIEDTALNFDAWGGFLPGPYVKWFSGVIGPEGLFKMLQAFPEKSATAVCTFAIYLNPDLINDIYNKLLSTNGVTNNYGDVGRKHGSGDATATPDQSYVKETSITIPSDANRKMNSISPYTRTEDILDFETELPNSNDIHLFKGLTRGSIVSPRYPDDIQVKKGAGGFGWDACFEPDSGVNSNVPREDPATTGGVQRRLTYAQMTSAQKNSISHRSKALVNLKNFLIKKYLS